MNILIGYLLRDKIMSGKVVIQWRYPYCAQITKRRYLDANTIPQIHSAISNLFFPADNEDRDSQGLNDNNNNEDSNGTDNDKILFKDQVKP